MEGRQCPARGVISFLAVFLFVLPSYSLELDSLSRGGVRSQLGTLYTLRNKLASGPRYPGSTIPTVSALRVPPVHQSRKESGVYGFQRSQTNPTSQFQHRMGRFDVQPIFPLKQLRNIGAGKWKKQGKSQRKKERGLNSFNFHQKQESEGKVVPFSLISTNLTKKGNDSDSSTLESEIPSTTPPSTFIQIKAIGQKINTALMNILTRKLMKMLDKDVPPGIFIPLKHLVASGNEMVEQWDKRSNARDGKHPGIVDILGYGLEQLKKFREGRAIKPTDPVANLTSPSKTFIQGILTVKRLTNRVLGYDQTNDLMKRGYGHDSYGHGGYMSYGHGGGLYGGLDPFSLLAALAFGAFLLQLLLTIMTTTARSLGVVTLNTPFMMPDFHVSDFMTSADKIFGTPTVRSKRSVGYEEPEKELFDSIIEKLDGVFKTYNQIAASPKCARIQMCRLVLEDWETDNKSILSPLYMYGLEQLGKEDRDANKFLEEIKNRLTDGETVDCDKVAEGCVAKWKDQLVDT